MIIPGRIRKVLSSLRRRLLYPYGGRAVAGLPPGMDYDTLNGLCARKLGEELRDISHVHISGWKTAGAYRLLLTTNRNRRWTVIYKNAIYDLEQIPALAGLPVRPGPPEYLVYSNPAGPLAAYLPEVYLCREIDPGKQYQYLLEDLRAKVYQTVSSDWHVPAAASLRAFHDAMGAWYSDVEAGGLLEYGQEFSTALREYARRNLERYLQQVRCRATSEICRRWPEIAKIHLRPEFRDMQAPGPIHGDFNGSNIHARTRGRFEVKLVDWEWAGLGTPHADLAALLKRARPEREAQALAVFAEHDKTMSLEEHGRLYEWCQLERGLLDASFLAVQHLQTSSRPALHLPSDIEDAMLRVLRAWGELR